MNIKYWASLALASFFFVSCDDTTDNIGSSLIDNVDKLNIKTDTFKVTTRSIIADSVLSRNTTGYIGRVRDPETGVYLTSNFMTQFYIPENFTFPERDSIKSLDINGDVIADSCDIRLYCTSYYGDSLAPMKMSVYELAKPVEETKYFYSNFNPEKEYLQDKSKMTSKVYTIADLNVDASTRYSSDYMQNIRIPLDKEYGTKIIREYYTNPETFKNAYTFIHKLVPGFYFKSTSGIGSMAYISISQLNVYFRHKTTATKSDGTKRDTIITSIAAFPGTEEVLQTSQIENDKVALMRLVNDKTCTYIKSPAGIFTEMDLPVDDIIRGHENDTINSAKIVLTRIINSQDNKYTPNPPTTLMMVPKAEMYTFFEQNKIVDYKTSFLASYSSSNNTYTFNNIGSLVKHIYEVSDRSYKDYLIPIFIGSNNPS